MLYDSYLYDVRRTLADSWQLDGILGDCTKPYLPSHIGTSFFKSSMKNTYFLSYRYNCFINSLNVSRLFYTRRNVVTQQVLLQFNLKYYCYFARKQQWLEFTAWCNWQQHWQLATIRAFNNNTSSGLKHTLKLHRPFRQAVRQRWPMALTRITWKLCPVVFKFSQASIWRY